MADLRVMPLRRYSYPVLEKTPAFGVLFDSELHVWMRCLAFSFVLFGILLIAPARAEILLLREFPDYEVFRWRGITTGCRRTPVERRRFSRSRHRVCESLVRRP